MTMLYRPPWVMIPTSPSAPAKISFSLLGAHELGGARPAHLDLVLLLRVARGRQDDPAVVELGRLEQRACARSRLAVGLRRERPVHVAGADAQLEHHRRARRLRELEPLLDHATIVGRSGRGSSSQICDFIANACVRSCMIEEPSP